MMARARSLLFFLLFASHARAVPLASQAPTGPPVRIWLGSGRTLASGDPARVYVQTSSDGNLVVLHARTDGRVEVLFPGEPASDPFVRAGTYEIRGPSGGDAFAASGPEGRGMVVAALSPDRMWFDEFVHDSNWDAAALTGAGASGDPEALLTDLVQRMLGDGSFNYDVVTYTLAPRPAAIVDAAADAPKPQSVCVDCSLTQVDLVVFSHHRRRGAAAPAVSPAPAAIAVYSVHRPSAREPLPLPAPRPVAPPTPRRRIPEPAVPAAPRSATLAVRAVPLVPRARPATAWATAATRSQLLVRFVHAARSPRAVLVPANESATPGIAAVSAPGLAAPAPPLATGGLIAVPATAPKSRAAAHAGVPTRAARAGTVEAAPAARAGPATGVGLESRSYRREASLVTQRTARMR
jgi:hypothetical protein